MMITVFAQNFATSGCIPHVDTASAKYLVLRLCHLRQRGTFQTRLLFSWSLLRSSCAEGCCVAATAEHMDV